MWNNALRYFIHYHVVAKKTRRSAVAERPRDAFCPSLVSFNITIPWAQSCSALLIHFSFRFTAAYTIKCCSVVFGETLTFLVINTSSSSPVSNKRRRLPAMSVTNLPRSGAAVYVTLGGRTVDNARWSQILFENRDFCLPHLHSMPPLRGPRRNIAIMFGVDKLEWCSYPVIKTCWKYVYSCRHNTRTWQTDGRTDGQRTTA